MKTINLVFLASLISTSVALAVDPPPDGGYPNQNTAEGEDALVSLTTGFDNSGVGYNALYNNTTGFFNTAIGSQALSANTTGAGNSATGYYAMMGNTTGSYNVADGQLALHSNTTGYNNTAVGEDALGANFTGGGNTAVGAAALFYGQSGSNNTAIGYSTFFNFFFGGSNNIAIGSLAGREVEHGDNNIEIGNGGALKDSGVIRIGTEGTQTATYIAGIAGVPVGEARSIGVTADGQLGVKPSSARYKEAIQPMDKSSEALRNLKPVTFRYKKELDPKGVCQFGLVAEEVAKVAPDLVDLDAKGKPFTVRYDEVNAMLLNEFLKEHRKVTAQGSEIAELKATVAELKSGLKEQAAELRKVSAQVATGQQSARLVSNGN